MQRGEFPTAFYTFGYNETAAMEYFPLSKDEALERGFDWQEKTYPINIPEQATVIQTGDLPDHIDAIDQSVCTKVIICADTGKPYRILSSELAFYQRNHIPVPRVHQDVRYEVNKQLLPERDFWLRDCDLSGEQVLSVYPEDVPFQVCSQQVYLHAIH